MTNGEEMRPNPRYTSLVNLLELAETAEADIAEALDAAFKVMDSGEAWAGPTTAAAFLDALGHHRDELPLIAERLVGDIRDTLQGVPEEISDPIPYGDDIPFI